ncbi:protein of unknown function [Methylorubrum extorquens]|uniref:Uncharacterized protein n=1 Tax=Methylorubrum extorquens TaxID=408 RepID=A0A2N9AQY7_METEX|nr:protein of unknown function [Methylorubrum extorquens]
MRPAMAAGSRAIASSDGWSGACGAVSASMVAHPAKLPCGITESMRGRPERFARRRTIRYRPHETGLSAREMSRFPLAPSGEIRQPGPRRSVRTSTSSKADPCG